jgi:hypothetical protein
LQYIIIGSLTKIQKPAYIIFVKIFEIYFVTKSLFHNKICLKFCLLIVQNNIHTCASVPVFVLDIAVLPIKGAVDKEREGAGHIKNQMEARAAYAGFPVEQEAVDSLEMLTDCATSWRLKVYGMGSLSGIGGAESSENGRRDEATAKVETRESPPVEEIQQVARRCSTFRPLQLYSKGVC